MTISRPQYSQFFMLATMCCLANSPYHRLNPLMPLNSISDFMILCAAGDASVNVIHFDKLLNN